MGASVTEKSPDADRAPAVARTAAADNQRVSVTASPATGLTVAVLAPTGQDGRVAEKVLTREGLEPRLCADMSDVCKLIGNEEVGVLLLAEEALAADA